jgi:hypothetical protein
MTAIEVPTAQTFETIDRARAHAWAKSCHDHYFHYIFFKTNGTYTVDYQAGAHSDETYTGECYHRRGFYLNGKLI